MKRISSDRVDLHMHSNISDGTDSPAEILARAREAGLALFALTDHDAVAGCADIRHLLENEPKTRAARSNPFSAQHCRSPKKRLRLQPHSSATGGESDAAACHSTSHCHAAGGSSQEEAPAPHFLTGVEFSCKDARGKYHILGYAFDPANATLAALIEKAHAMRMAKLERRLAFLEKAFDITFPEEDIAALHALHNPAKPHLANLLVRDGHAATRAEAFSDYLNKKRFPNAYVTPQEAVSAILAAGGVPILAHPTFGDGEAFITGEAMEERVRYLMEFGVAGLEAYYYGLPAAQEAELLKLAERYGLYVTTGSDYHGTNKTVPFGATPLNSVAGRGCPGTPGEADREVAPGFWRFLERVL